jgi:hypothetical protein
LSDRPQTKQSLVDAALLQVMAAADPADPQTADIANHWPGPQRSRLFLNTLSRMLARVSGAEDDNVGARYCKNPAQSVIKARRGPSFAVSLQHTDLIQYMRQWNTKPPHPPVNGPETITRRSGCATGRTIPIKMARLNATQ